MRADRVWRGPALSAAIVGLGACGTDQLAAPPPPPSVAGSWIYAASGLSADFLGDPVTCEYDLTMQIPETGPTFTGSYRDALLVCTLRGTSHPVIVGGGEIVAGILARDSVQFDFDSAGIHNAGTISGDGMSGWVEIELVIQVDADIDTVLVAGGWSATR